MRVPHVSPASVTSWAAAWPRRVSVRTLSFWALTTLIGAFVVVPLVLMVVNSFRTVDPADLNFGVDNLTVGNYRDAYNSPTAFRMLGNSFWFAGGSMLVGMSIGSILAFLYERTDFRFRRFLPVLAIVPLATPGIVDAIAWVFLLSPGSGLINTWWRAIGFEGHLVSAYSIPAMIWVQGYGTITLTFLLVGAIMRRMDPALEEAAQGAGASMPRVMTKITLPLIMPGLLAVALLLFVRGIEAFEIPLVLGFPTGITVFSTNIFYSLRGAYPPDYGAGFSFSAALLLVTVVAILLYLKQVRRSESYAVILGKGYRPRMLRLGKGAYFAYGIVGFYTFFVVILPLFILLWASVLPFYEVPSVSALSNVTLNNYRDAISEPTLPRVLMNTLLLAMCVGTVVMLISFMASWFIFRTVVKGRFVLEFLVFLPYAIPGVVVAVAFLIVFLIVPNPIYNTIWIIILAYIFNMLPLGTRFTHPAVVQVHRDLEEAARGAGAGFWATAWHVWFPLLRPALINGWLFVAIVSVKVLTLAQFLQGPGNQVFAVHLLDTFEDNPGEAAALSSLFVVAVGVLTIVSLTLRQRSETQQGLAV